MSKATHMAWLLLLLACDREERRFMELSPSSGTAQVHKRSALAPAQAKASASSLPAREQPPGTLLHLYQRNAWAIGEGARYFVWFNCTGCHGRGGGGSGPALMDPEWRYGSGPEDVYASIAGGRPNGMPAFGDKVPQQQLWQLVAYVRSMSGLVPLDAAPGRPEALRPHTPEVMLKHRGVPAPRREHVKGSP